MDHLLCYPVRDPLQVAAVLDGIAEQQPEFTGKRCKITRPIEFCVPVTKTGVKPPHPEGPPGQPLRDDYVCYALQCASPPPPKKTVTDQFGTRQQAYGPPTKFCAPARKQPAAQSCGPTPAGQCGGTCSDPAQKCIPVAGTPLQCRCITP
jgi:hypothetical protein